MTKSIFYPVRHNGSLRHAIMVFFEREEAADRLAELLSSYEGHLRYEVCSVNLQGTEFDEAPVANIAYLIVNHWAGNLLVEQAYADFEAAEARLNEWKGYNSEWTIHHVVVL